MSYERLMQPHLQQRRLQAEQQQQPVLLIQDMTEVNYQHHPKTTGLGPIGNGTGQGYLLQTVLAVGAQTPEVLGVMHQEPFLRKPAPAGETKRQRERRERE